MPDFQYIGRIARETGLSVHAIRFYERQGLLKPPLRSEGRFRVFSGEEVRDLKFIRRAQELGFSLAEIRELLVLRGTTPQACTHVRELLTKSLQRVKQKLDDLTRLRNTLNTALRKCNHDLKGPRSKTVTSCRVLSDIDVAAGASHLGT